MNTDRYIEGQRDCAEGNPWRDGMGRDYNDGYSTQYQHEQNMNAVDEVKYGSSN